MTGKCLTVESSGSGETRVIKNEERKATAPANHETEEKRLRDLLCRLYQIAGQVLESNEPDEALRILLLDVLANPDGKAARKLNECD